MQRKIKIVGVLLCAAVLCFSGNISATGNTETNENVGISQQKRKITGTVEDALGPVIGASIAVKGTSIGTISDADGKFSLDVSDGQTIVISFIGYVSQEIRIEGQNTLNIMLNEDSQVLDEVVVTALGIKRESKKLGYAVSSIPADELVKTGTPNFATALYGKAAGVRVQAAPGGGSSAVSINVRGINSISGSTQPLIVLDGIPIRNGDANNDDYWTDQRVRGNGLVDINPEDIESLSILKGASASALYGSEAANGVVLITTKSGAGKKGVSVDFAVTFGVDKAAYLPKYQTTYGPGDYREGRSGDWLDNDGWRYETYKGKEYIRPRYETYFNFGPRFDGREVLYWDGTTRNYNAYNDGKGWEDLFRTGHNGTYNLAVSTGGEKSSTRFSYTYYDQKNLQRESSIGRHSFNLSGMMQPLSRVKLDYNISYMRKKDMNRPYRFNRLTNNFTGMLSTMDDPNRIYDKTVTSLGYLNVFANAETPTPDESFLYTLGSRDLVGGYYWNIRKKTEEEETNRLIGNLTATVDIYDGLSLRVKAGTDFTSDKIEAKHSTEKPLVIGNSGYYGLHDKRYEIYYGEALLQYAKDFNETWGVTATAGYMGRQEKMNNAKVGTDGGLSVENWFHINASVNNIKEAKMDKQSFIKEAFFGMAGVSFKNYLFLDGTIRHEKSSTLLTGNNSYTYPSVNGSFLISEALGSSNPNWMDYLKLRASYGIVGNAPEIYKANYAFNQESLNSYTWNQLPKEINNSKLKPEEKHEMEFGLEGKFFKNRAGFEMTYYKNVTKDQILKTTTSWSAGAEAVWENVGELQNTGWEFALYGTPVQTRDFQWDLRGNISFNSNKVNKLVDGQTFLQHGELDGAVIFQSEVGKKAGDLYSYLPIEIDGQPVVGDDGMYIIDKTEMKKVGNVLPDAVGGFSTSFSWKGFFVDASIDFSIGGDVVNTPYQFMMRTGNIEESLKWRGVENGGLRYYYSDPGNLNSEKILVKGSETAGPSGQPIYDDGMILSGVKENGTPNQTIVAAPTYYYTAYGWGAGGNKRTYANSVFDNTYVKFRELTLGYSLPKKITSRFGCNNLTVSVFGRNLFYFYKRLPLFDAESMDGTRWTTRYNIGGSTAAARTFGFSIRGSF